MTIRKIPIPLLLIRCTLLPVDARNLARLWLAQITHNAIPLHPVARRYVMGLAWLTLPIMLAVILPWWVFRPVVETPTPGRGEDHFAA